MLSVIINETPQDLAALLGVDGRGVTGVNSSIWSGLCQNLSATRTIFRLRSATQPDPTAPAFRHRPGEQFRLALWSGLPTWLWVSRGVVCFIVEEVGDRDRV